MLSNSSSSSGLKTLVRPPHAWRYAWSALTKTPRIDIERTYGGGRKPIAGKPSSGTWPAVREPTEIQDAEKTRNAGLLRVDVPVGGETTPSATEGETDSEWDERHEATTPAIEEEEEEDKVLTARKASFDHGHVQETTTATTTSATSTTANSTGGSEGYRLSMKALTIKYLQKPMVIFSNIDTFRWVSFCPFGCWTGG